MDNFSISQLQQFSGVKAHTIRIWEQRYNALAPIRSEGNTRYYDSSQLRRLLNIVSLTSDGHKISKLGKLSDNELFDMLEQRLDSDIELEQDISHYVLQLVAAAIDFDEVHFDKTFNSSVKQLGMRATYSKVLYPTLKRVGLMWSANCMSAAHEHFSSNLIKQKIFSAIDSLPQPESNKPSWVLFLPENEFHEIGLLFSHYLLRHSGVRVYYLGNNMPFEILKSAVEQSGATHLLFFLVRNNTIESTNEYLEEITNRFGDKSIYASGQETVISNAAHIKGINWLHSAEDFENKLK